MAENAGAIYYTVDADTSKVIDGLEQLGTSVDKVNTTLNQVDKTVDKTTARLTKTAAAAKQLANEAQGANAPLSNMARLLGGIVTLQGAGGLVRMAEAYAEMAERVQMASASTAEFEMVQSRLLETANGTYRSLAEAQEMYILTADAIRGMGYSTDQALDITDSLSYAFVKNATSVERANSAISAFSGAVMTGRVEADSWKTIIAATPTIINDIAAATGKSANEIRKMGAEGKITASILSEGLRQSLDSNKEAAAGMATTVKDAFQAMSNNLSAYVGEANNATGVTAAMSKAILYLGENIDTIAKLLLTLGAGALAKYITQLGASAVANGAAAIAASRQAQAELQLAQAHVATTAATLAQVQATGALIAGQGTAASAAAALAAAQRGLAAAQATASAASVGLLGMLGGPVGIVALLAAGGAAAYLFGSKTMGAVPAVDTLANSVEKLTANMLDLRKQQAAEAVERLTRDAQSASASVKGLEKDFKSLEDSRKAGANITAAEMQNVTKTLTEQKVASDESVKALQAAINAQEKLQAESARRASTGGKPNATPVPKMQADPEVTKRLEQMRDELELAKLTGVARAKLQAIQKLGTNATAEERAEAEKLATTIFNLTEGRKAGAKVSSESAKQQKKDAAELEKLEKQKADGYLRNGETMQQLAQQLALAGLEGRELAEAQAALSLNEYATPEQIETVKQLGAALFEAQKRKEALSQMGSSEMDVSSFVRGSGGTELTGGQYDNQQARYDNDAKKEQERYAGQLQRLTMAMEAEKYTLTTYQAEFEKLSKEHNDRMTQISQAKYSLQMSDASNAFGSIADATKQFAGEQSGIYKAMFAVSKAFAIADAIVKIQAGIANAAATPFPGNIAAMASVASATAGIISTISGTSMGGGRQYGGPVSPGKMHRINENGKPEILNASNGQQYLLPNTRGKVVSNSDATRGAAGGGVEVSTTAPISVSTTINVSSSGTSTQQTVQGGGGDNAGKALADLMNAAITEKLQKEQRPGGILWRMANGR